MRAPLYGVERGFCQASGPLPGSRHGRQLLAITILLLSACGKEPADPTPELRPDAPVVLISIDTLRADRLPAYGYAGVETPAIDALRRDAVLFERAYSHIPLTLPSHASLLTGLLPAEHGLRDNIGYVLDGERVPLLQRSLKERGYATGAAVSTFVLRSRMGLAEGFDFYEDSIEFRPGVGLGGLQRRGEETLDLARDWLRGAAGKPFFFFFHLYEPHSPYDPPEPFKSRYASPYDGEVASADRVVGLLLDELRRLGVYDKALVVLLSDHGEGLGEHGEDEHGVLLYKTTLHVPLIVKLPGAELAGAASGAPVQLVDVFPTVAELVGLPLPDALRGTSLLRQLDGTAPARWIYAETFYPRIHFGWSELASLIDGEHHYVEGPDPELYELTADPGELVNVLRDRRRVYAELRDELATHERALEAPGEVDEESRRALAALGYLSTSPTASDGPLPDPKSRLHTLGDLRAGFRHHSAKEHREAAAAFRRALAENPRMTDAWEFMAQSLQALGEREEALDAYKKALELSGGASHLAISAAALFFDLRRVDEAEAHARLSLATHPSFAHGLLAQIAVERGELETAESEARLALEDKQHRVGPRVILAEVFHAQGRYEEALAMVREAEEAYAERQSEAPELIRGLHLHKGTTLADLGRAEDAEAAFRKELELFPESIYAYSRLALLYGLTGRPAEVPAVLRRMVETVPAAASYAEAVRTLRVLQSPGAEDLLGYARRLYPDDEGLADLAEEAGR